MSTNSKIPEKRVKLSPGGSANNRRGQWIGGWSYVLRYGEHTIRPHGCEWSKSEVRMELIGAVNGLRRLKYPCQVELFTGCEYLSDGIRRLRRRSRSDPFVAGVHLGTGKNADFWRKMEQLLQVHQVEIRWVPFRTKSVDSRDARASARNACCSPPSSGRQRQSQTERPIVHPEHPQSGSAAIQCEDMPAEVTASDLKRDGFPE